MRQKLRNLHAKSQEPSSYKFRDLSVYPDGQTDGQTDMARSTRLVILINNIHTLWCLPITYFSTNLVYPFILRVTGITGERHKTEKKYVVSKGRN